MVDRRPILHRARTWSAEISPSRLFRAEVEVAWPHCLRRQRAEIPFAGHRVACSCWRTRATEAW